MPTFTIMKLSELPQAGVDEAVALYWQAFGGKLAHVLGPQDKALRLLKKAVGRDHAFVAVSPLGRVVGVAGYRSPEGSFVHLNQRHMTAVHGPVMGRLRLLLLMLLGTDEDTERFLVDGLAVVEDRRSQGIGTAMIEALRREASRRGYARMRLDVADHNLRARGLYERLGFAVVGHQPLRWLAPIFGMRGATIMEMPV